MYLYTEASLNLAGTLPIGRGGGGGAVDLPEFSLFRPIILESFLYIPIDVNSNQNFFIEKFENLGVPQDVSMTTALANLRNLEKFDISGPVAPTELLLCLKDAESAHLYETY